VRAGIRGAGSVETTAGEEWVATAERHKSMPKTTCVKANRTLDAVSDGAFAATHHGVLAAVPAILITTVPLQFQPMPKEKRRRFPLRLESVNLTSSNTVFKTLPKIQ